MAKDMFTIFGNMMAAMGEAQLASMRAASQTMELTMKTQQRIWGIAPEPEASKDKRFRDDSWQENPAADTLKDSYLIYSQWLLGVADGLESINPTLHHRVKFWTQQWIDAISPSNYPLTNPVVIQEIAKTGGMNLIHGMQNAITDALQGRISQVPSDSFEVGVDLAITPGKVVYRNPVIELIQYEPTTKKVSDIPILVIPPWINRYYVMDMQPHNSMYKYLVDSGFTLFTISWKNPDDSTLGMDWDDYMEYGPLTAIKIDKSITGSEKINTVGYCLGGIIEQVTVAYLAAIGDESVNSATLFTAHQDFSDAGDISVFISGPEVVFLEWLMAASGGYLDGKNMAATFNMLRSNDLLWNYYVHNYLLGKEPPSFDLLYWNSDGTRVPGRVHSFLMREMFLENKLMKPNAMIAKGEPIDLGKIKIPTYAVASKSDHIVPWRGAFNIRELQGGPVRFILSGGGHIAGIINPPADKKRAYWINEGEDSDPDVWFEGAQRFEGSWWDDWTSWLKERSGDAITPPSMGNDEFKPIMDAPGSYVLEV
ncbi:MAG: PHA/PHB synthase family protein [Candidatus Promineifilaceae bacterium]